MNIAILGLGIIGGAWARNLIADGHAVRCWNRTPRDFPNFYPSIQEAVEGAEAIFVVVSDPPCSRWWIKWSRGLGRARSSSSRARSPLAGRCDSRTRCGKPGRRSWKLRSPEAKSPRRTGRRFILKHMDKDLRLPLETAADLSLPIEQTKLLKRTYDQGIGAGWKDDDFIGLARLLEKA